MLGVTLERYENEQKYTFPVGKADEIIVYPLDFEEFLWVEDYRGAITENYVACALQNKIQSLAHELYYWKASEKSGSAEVDFIIATGHGNIPIEVKSGLHVRSQSLNLFIRKYSPPYALRVSEKNFGWENSIKSVPLYAVFCLDEMI